MSRTRFQILTAIISVLDKMIDVLFILAGLLLWVTTGFLIYYVYMLASMAREAAWLDIIIYLTLALVLTFLAPIILILGYTIIRNSIRGLKGEEI